MSFQNLWKTRKCGAIVRVFAKKPDAVTGAAAKTEKAIRALLAMEAFGDRMIRHIDILVPEDKQYTDCDCGETAGAIRDMIRAHEHDGDFPISVKVHQVEHGDLFCGALNYGIATQVRHHKVDYSLIISPEATEYATNDVAEKITQAIGEHRARAVGVGINELIEQVETGRIANTFALWHVETLQTVGSFDLQAAQAHADNRLTPYIQGHMDGKDLYYPRAGVEEIIPLVRMIRMFGACVGVVRPDSMREWVLPTDPDTLARHHKKMATKVSRQAIMAGAAGADLSFLEGGVKVRL